MSRARKSGGDAPAPGPPPFGWVPFGDRTAEQNATHERIVGAMPRFALRGRFRNAERRVSLWKAHESLFGTHARFNWQVTGSCVGAGGGNMLKILMAVEIAFGMEAERYERLWWPHTYGLSRMVAGLRGRGEGSFGSAWAEAIERYGMFDAARPGLPSFEETQGWLRLSKGAELEWSDGGAIDDRWKEAGREHLVRTVSRMRSSDDCFEAIAGAKTPLTLASNFGMRDMTPRVTGDPGVRLGRWDGNWPHQMSCNEAWDHPSLGLIFHIQNNWGPDAHGRPTQGEPPGGFYVEARTMDRICRDGEVYAFSAFDGFPAREWDWLF